MAMTSMFPRVLKLLTVDGDKRRLDCAVAASILPLSSYLKTYSRSGS